MLERLIPGSIEADFVWVAASAAFFSLAFALYFARRAWPALQRRMTKRS